MSTQLQRYHRRRQLERRYINRILRQDEFEFWKLRYDDNHGDERLVFSTGWSATLCSGYAVDLQRRFGRARVTTYGYFCSENRGTVAGDFSGGHDFAVLDREWIIDPWLTDVADIWPVGVFHLVEDADVIPYIYGPSTKWRVTDLPHNIPIE